jgi:HrpA-like RNA helicase
MSATLQTNELTDYFAEFNPAQVKVEGRTFPVQEFFLEDVLTMTGYIDASTGYDASLVANKEIEHELAALKNQQESLLMKCSLCGQDFVDAIELGTHMAVCDVGDSTGFIINKENEKVLETFMTGAPTFSSQFASPEGYDDNSATVVGEFEDYDVEGTPEVVAYESFSVGAPKASVVQEEEIVEANEHEQPKWDGKSSFKITHPETNSPNQSDDALLDQYQAMHDDEQVDYFLLLEVIHYIVKSSYGDGAILVFFPGWQEISEFTLLLEGTAPFHNSSKYLILPLHSGISSQDQRRVLQRPPEGTRKIVLATNIAETSLTIEDVAFVVDSGRAKLKDYDPHLKTSTLQPTWISKASSKQRKGRAGRTKAGVCFHLFSRRRYENMADFVESELLRTPLVRKSKCLFSCRVMKPTLNYPAISL